jgi:hypothetical protein
MTLSTDEHDRLTERRDQIRDEFLAPRERRAATSARGIHHTALICADVRRTVEFYQNF